MMATIPEVANAVEKLSTREITLNAICRIYPTFENNGHIKSGLPIMTKRLTLKQINKTLKQMGISERLFKGDGYFYFAEGNAHTWSESSLYWYDLEGITMQDVLNEFDRLKM